MGWPPGYSDADCDIPLPAYNPHHFDREPEGVGRVAVNVKNRIDRLKADGNAVCSPCAYPIYAVIVAVERSKAL